MILKKGSTRGFTLPRKQSMRSILGLMQMHPLIPFLRVHRLDGWKYLMNDPRDSSGSIQYREKNSGLILLLQFCRRVHCKKYYDWYDWLTMICIWLISGFPFVKPFQMEDYAKKNYQQRRGFFSFRKTPIDELLSFSNKPINYPLRRMSYSYSSIAITFNQDIWDYTDVSRFVENRNSCLRHLIFILIASPPPLVDEYYCQVIKQMTKCPTQ